LVDTIFLAVFQRYSFTPVYIGATRSLPGFTRKGLTPHKFLPMPADTTRWQRSRFIRP